MKVKRRSLPWSANEKCYIHNGEKVTYDFDKKQIETIKYMLCKNGSDTKMRQLGNSVLKDIFRI